ncbi:MAG: hypothetical protein FWC15_07595 [Fibromonadales bacterium]|nr:hypothetical protein [Fibromonadales bacterium]
MKKICFSVAVFVLLFVACGTHEFIEDFSEPEDSSSSNRSSSSVPSSSSLSSSAGTSSSSSLGSSSSDEESCELDFELNNTITINTECVYSATVTIPDGKGINIGSQAKLKFTDNVNFVLDGYNTLNIAEGAELKFGENSKLQIDIGTTLNISGTEGKPVILAAIDPDKLWGGIGAGSNTQININHVDLSGALTGISFANAGILKNSKIHDNTYGIKSNVSFGNGNFSGNNFYSNVYDADVRLTVAATLGSPEQFKGMLRINENQLVEEEISLPGFTYFVNGMITVKNKLEIQAGAHFYLSENSMFYVWSGSIKAIGKTDSLIIFESVDESTFWGGETDKAAFLFIENGSGEFQYFEVIRAEKAFVNNSSGSVTLSNGQIKDFRISDYSTDGSFNSRGICDLKVGISCPDVETNQYEE